MDLLLDLWLFEFGVMDDRVRHEPFALDVRLDQGYREIEPRVQIVETHHKGRFALTLTEAERLSNALIQAVALARGDGKTVRSAGGVDRQTATILGDSAEEMGE